jgi:restriction system protein
MAEITYRRTGELLRRLFEILIETPEGLPAGEAIGRLAERMTLTPYELGTYPSGGRRFDKIIRFSTVDCVKAGWLLKHKGTWVVTEVGQEAYKTIADPENFYRQAVKLYRAWKASQPGGTAEAAPSASTSDATLEDEAVEKSAGVTFEQADEQAWTEIEQFLHAMNPFDFQHLVADLLKGMGYHVAWISPPGKDGGVDILAHNDPLGTRPPRIKVQVKRVLQRVDLDTVKSFVAVLDDDDVGIFVSAGGFTRDADEFARSHARRKVTLMDLDRLVDLWIEFYGRLDDTARRRLPLTPIYFLTPQT